MGRDPIQTGGRGRDLPALTLTVNNSFFLNIEQHVTASKLF